MLTNRVALGLAGAAWVAALSCCSHPAVKVASVPDSSCRDAAEVASLVGTALEVVRAVATDLWPDWTPGQVPIVFAQRDGTRWAVGAPPAGQRSRRACGSRLGPIHLLAAEVPATERARFFASAGLEDGQLRLDIGSPTVAPFPRCIWFTVFTHEYFHAHQLSQESWLARMRAGMGGSPGKGPVSRLLRLYEERADFRGRIAAELSLLRAMVAAGVPDRVSLEKLLSLRRDHRQKLHAMDPSLPRAEVAGEIIEGTARFVDSRVFQSPTARAIIRSFDPGCSMPDAAREQESAFGISDGNKYYYATGYALSVLASRLAPGWEKELAQRGFDAILEGARREPRPAGQTGIR